LNRYIVESNHDAEECLHVLELVVAHGYITHYDWGCEAGVHTGWAVIEADSEEEAIMSVPSSMRSRARAIRLTKYTPRMIERFHRPKKK